MPKTLSIEKLLKIAKNREWAKSYLQARYQAIKNKKKKSTILQRIAKKVRNFLGRI
jgi:hypothetical protein